MVGEVGGHGGGGPERRVEPGEVVEGVPEAQRVPEAPERLPRGQPETLSVPPTSAGDLERSPNVSQKP